ncbi:hypothetical protein BJ741DRAFT_594131 [Chytriomyces cf. hyalinus JEL632]|nr:hypothetical protein BJ741DRAFT_594131 [Chytriomyces cf. hyalinus JEL632]
MSQPIHTLTTSERPAAIETLVAAFLRDGSIVPFVHGPDPKVQQERLLTRFSTLLADPTVEVVASEDFNCVSVWERKTVEDKESAAAAPTQQPRQEVADFFKKVYDIGPPKPFLYLAFLATKVAGKGAGSNMLRQKLALLDAQEPSGKKAQVYLWTANPANVEFYKKFGFVVYSEVHLQESCWWMVRE